MNVKENALMANLIGKRTEIMDRNPELIKYVFHNNGDVMDKGVALDMVIANYKKFKGILEEGMETYYNMPPGYNIADFESEYEYLISE
jgi:hypothetical protein